MLKHSSPETLKPVRHFLRLGLWREKVAGSTAGSYWSTSRTCPKAQLRYREGSENASKATRKSGFSTGRIIPNAKRPVIARKVHSGALPTSVRACRVGWLDGHSAQRYPATQFVDLAGGISPRHLEANAPPVDSASDIAETDNSDRR
jgi:hypothetical protein